MINLGQKYHPTSTGCKPGLWLRRLMIECVLAWAPGPFFRPSTRRPKGLAVCLLANEGSPSQNADLTDLLKSNGSLLDPNNVLPLLFVFKPGRGSGAHQETRHRFTHGDPFAVRLSFHIPSGALGPIGPVGQSKTPYLRKDQHVLSAPCLGRQVFPCSQS